MHYDILVIGSGPGGYVAAIRAAQLGHKTAVIERAELGGICLNWGCIPTKALLKSAQAFNTIKHASDYGIEIGGEPVANIDAIVSRSRNVSENMSKGVQYLLKKNKIDVINGNAVLKPGKKVEVTTIEGNKETYKANHIIIATGARSKQLPNLVQDGKRIIGYREALVLRQKPESMLVVGSGAIGSEFAFYYNSLGVKVTLVEFMPNIVPVEDEDVSKQLERSFKKAGIKVMTNSSVESVDTTGDKCIVEIKTPKAVQQLECDIVLSAVGITPNIENIGLEEVGINISNGKVQVDEYYRTNVEGYYAIGDIVPGQALAHVASAEALVCIEKISGLQAEPIDYSNIPGCTYTNPEVASVGMTEKKAKEAGLELKIGKFPFMASGKANASGNRDGFIKLIFNAQDDKLIGAHFVGENVTEMIAEAVVARKMQATAQDILKSVHPHPTLSESIIEAVADAYGEAIHL